MTSSHSQQDFENIRLLQTGYRSASRQVFDRGLTVFPKTVLAFVRETHQSEIPSRWRAAAKSCGRYARKIEQAEPLETTELGAIRQATGRKIGLGKERRGTIVAASVTGQIQVEAEA